MLRGIRKIVSVRSSLVQHVRTLYSMEGLGVDKYLYSRERINTQFVNSTEKFKQKMVEYTDDKSEHMIFTEDLKNMVHMVDNEADVSLVERMIRKFNLQNKELRFGNFVFGPVVMRMLHLQKNPDAALKLFLDEGMDGFFDQMITYQVLLDLLYESGRYADVRSTYDTIKGRQLEGARYPKNCLVLVFGACYKENTLEAFDYSKALWTELSEAGHLPMRKAATFAAGLALRQNAPHIALEIISSVPQQNYVSVRNLKIQALIALNRYTDVVPLLRGILEVAPTGSNKQQTITKDVMENVKAAIGRSEDRDLQGDFARVEKFLTEHDHVSTSTLDELLCKSIENRNNFDNNSGPSGFNRNRGQAYNQNRGGGGNKFRTQRPGLRDLY